MATTLLLDTEAWDMVLDANGNWALAAEPYSIAQDASSECRTFEGEVYYDTNKGVPYFQEVLGKFPPAAILKNAYQNAALLVPHVKSVVCYLQVGPNRTLKGQLQITDVNGQVLVAPSGPKAPTVLPVFSPGGGGVTPPAPPPVSPPPISPPPISPPPPATPGEFDFSDPTQSENSGLQ